MIARPELTLDVIVDATLVMAREIGFDKVSLRPLAAELNVTPTALYYHVRNKTELLDAAALRIFASLDMPDPGLPWTDRMRKFLIDHNRLLHVYPGLARFLISRSRGAVSRRWRRTMLDILQEGGFRGEKLYAAIAAFTFYIDPTTLISEIPQDEPLLDVGDDDATPCRTYGYYYRLGLDRLLATFDEELKRAIFEDEPVPAMLARAPIGAMGGQAALS